MNIRTLIVAFAFIAQSVTAGEMYSGWGEDPEKAMEAAMTRAEKDSTGGCICKDWGPDIEKLCVKSNLGGVTCKACGSNEKGSCESQAEIDRIVRAVEKLKPLFKD